MFQHFGAQSPLIHARSSRPIGLLFGVIFGLETFATTALASPSITSLEQGYALGAIQNARSVAMSGAEAALGISTTALFSNPANMAIARVYHAEASAGYSPEARRQSYSGAIVDSMSSRMAGGIGGAWNLLDPDGVKRRWIDGRAGLAFALGDMVAIGAAGRFVWLEQSTGTGPFGPSLAADGLPGRPILTRFTFDAGMTISPTPSLRIAGVGHNLTNSKLGMLPMSAGGGIGFTSSQVNLEANVLADFATWGKPKALLMAGGEVFLGGHFPLRAGYRYDDGGKIHSLSAGLGYVDRVWGIEVGARRDIVAKAPMTILSLSIRYFYDGGQPATAGR